ncbi:MAG: bifunctional diaminohydroxyphosphoribosylaminopyrimidine deaminase/5-amino-6-(5-phosphoribosylamino)uracil reductase RibD [Steroidobacterales bacterium]
MSPFTAFDESCMRRALALAERGLYTTDPNPRVGCAIARDGEIVGEGWHRKAGEAHAEVLALAHAGEKSRGATVYVTLEPCAHQGRTPPCADALIRAAVARVVAATQDHNPRVNGAGADKLRAAGIAVDFGLLADEARALNPGFFHRHATGRPWVRVKLAMTLDGRTALASGESRWITGEAARADVQHWRARSSAVVTGIGTVLADDPRLDVRICAPGGEMRQPLRVIADARGRTPPAARILDAPGECWIVVGAGTLLDVGARKATVHEIAKSPSGVDLHALLGLLAARELNEVLVEAGPGLAGAFVAQCLVDELIVYVAPRFLGAEGRPLVLLPPIAQIEGGPAWQITDVRRFDGDLRIMAIPR